jgi:hypothetical protein
MRSNASASISPARRNFYRFGDHAFRNGEYVSIRDEDGEMHTFQVVSVEPAT